MFPGKWTFTPAAAKVTCIANPTTSRMWRRLKLTGHHSGSARIQSLPLRNSYFEISDGLDDSFTMSPFLSCKQRIDCWQACWIRKILGWRHIHSSMGYIVRQQTLATHDSRRLVSHCYQYFLSWVLFGKTLSTPCSRLKYPSHLRLEHR